MRVVLAYVSPRQAAGEIHVFPVHANVLFLTEARPIPDTPRTLASTSPSGSVSPKIIQKISQGATPEHRTLQSSNLARCNKTTSHPATLSCCTLQHRAIAPCHFLLSHPATQKARFLPPRTARPSPECVGLAAFCAIACTPRVSSPIYTPSDSSISPSVVGNYRHALVFRARPHLRHAAEFGTIRTEPVKGLTSTRQGTAEAAQGRGNPALAFLRTL